LGFRAAKAIFERNHLVTSSQSVHHRRDGFTLPIVKALNRPTLALKLAATPFLAEKERNRGYAGRNQVVTTLTGRLGPLLALQNLVTLFRNQLVTTS
jgi:hypothetical protein